MRVRFTRRPGQSHPSNPDARLYGLEVARRGVGRFLCPNVERVIWVNVRRINPFAGPSQHRDVVLGLIGISNQAVENHEST